MIISTDPEKINREEYQKWVNLLDDETCVAWFGKGFVSFNKGFLFTDQRVLEIDKKKLLTEVRLSEISDTNFHTNEIFENSGMGLHVIKGSFSLFIKGKATLYINVDESYEAVTKGLTAVAGLVSQPMTFSGDPGFNLSTNPGDKMQQDGATVKIKIEKGTFGNIVSSNRYEQGFIMDKDHYTQIASQPVFKFPPICAWSGQPAASITAPFVLETEEQDMKETNPIFNAGKVIANFILTAGKRVDNFIKLIMHFSLPVAEGVDSTTAPQWKFSIDGKLSTLSIHFPSEELAAEFVKINTETE